MIMTELSRFCQNKKLPDGNNETNEKGCDSMVKTITAENFEQEVVHSAKTVVLDFWASWCGPCRMFTPIIEKFAEDNPEVMVGKVNVDEQSSLAERFSIMGVPSLVILKDGQVVKKNTGVITKEAIEAMLP